MQSKKNMDYRPFEEGANARRLCPTGYEPAHWVRAQEGAPFELLVAVVVMGFVLLAGFRVIGILQLEECKGKLDSNLEELKTAIENVAHGEGQRTVAYTKPSCFPEPDAENKSEGSRLEIIHRTEARICSEFCSGARIECTLLAFSSIDHSNWKCLNISSATDFPSSSDCSDFDPGEYEAQQWKRDGILEGQYILVKKFNEFSQQPRICAYRRGN
ncbi:MAG: hypothetical protein HY392_01665 [Candidatus Diapherotrites archaeon]|nr:hypothetical protein [Candidatus Diapherotrites archaeon]